MFDQARVQNNRKKCARAIKNSEFYQFVYNDLANRINEADQTFSTILIIGSVIDKFFIQKFKDSPVIDSNPMKIDEIELGQIVQYLADKANIYDIIIFPFGLHWISDVLGILKLIKMSLKPDGIFIGNFPGAGSLIFLRKILIELEIDEHKSHIPHIIPFISFEQMVALLQSAGFTENIVDTEKLELEFASCLELMKTIKKIGEGNALTNGITYSINKNMYKRLNQSAKSEQFNDQVNLISFIASPNKHSIKIRDFKIN